MYHIFKIFSFFLVVSSSLFGELPDILIDKDKNSGATFEVKFLTSEEKKELLKLHNSSDTTLLNHEAYRLITSNLPTNTVYSLYTVNGENKARLEGKYTTSNGYDLKPLDKNAQGAYLSDYLQIVNHDFMNGEPISRKLVSADSKIKLIVKMTPNPIKYKWNDGAIAYMELNSSAADLFTFHAKGLQPNEPITFTTISGNEKFSHDCTVNGHGAITIGLEPATIGNKGGQAKVILTRKNMEPAILRYSWGDQAQKEKR